MDKELLKSIVAYYCSLEKIHDKWRKSCGDAADALRALENFTEQLRCVCSREVDDAEICGIDGMRERLIFKINVRIDEEVKTVIGVVYALGNLNQELKSKLTQLEKMRSTVSVDDPEMREIVQGTPLRPRLNLLLEWAIDAQLYYRQLYDEINEDFKALDRTQPDTVVKLIKSFRDEGDISQINRILAFTQYLVKEPVR